MTSNLPLVTVIAACYNHERFIVQCLESIRNQTYPNIQLIITDDYSTDCSVNIINDWIKKNKSTCYFISHKENKGFPKTLNEALKITEGEYVAIIATDDIWLPEFIEDRVRIFNSSDENLGVIYGKSLKISENDDILPGLFQNCEATPTGFVLEELIKENFIAANSVLIRKRCFDFVGQYNETLTLEDYDMWLRIAKRFKFEYSHNILSKYRILGNSLDHSNRGKMYSDVTRILLSNLESNPEYKEIIVNRLLPYRNIVYSLQHSLTPMVYFKSLQKRFRKRDLLLWLFSLFGLSYKTSCRIISQHNPEFDKIFFFDK